MVWLVLEIKRGRVGGERKEITEWKGEKPRNDEGINQGVMRGDFRGGKRRHQELVRGDIREWLGDKSGGGEERNQVLM